MTRVKNGTTIQTAGILNMHLMVEHMTVFRAMVNTIGQKASSTLNVNTVSIVRWILALVMSREKNILRARLGDHLLVDRLCL